MKSPMLLWKELAVELGGELGVDTSRDFETVASRVKHEGDEFLTITLPTLRKALEKGLASGSWNPQLCTSFSSYKSLPRFLGGFFELVFDRDSGEILDKPNVQAIAFIRQLTGIFGSLEPDQVHGENGAGCSEERLIKAFIHYLETDEEVAQQSMLITGREIREFQHALNRIFGSVLSHVDSDTGLGRLRPRHSGGATADRLRGNQKWKFPEWTDRLEEIFPYLENTIHSFGVTAHRLEADGTGLSVLFRNPENELPVRVIAVPKTVEKPRIISIEPSYMQYMQQAVARAIVSGFEHDSRISQVIRLHEREHNQLAAQIGSVDGSLATLDLRDASDRLSWRLVREGFASWPWLVRALDATRSRRADVAGANVRTLAKFASMGSALTFPIQTMVFTTIAFMGVAETHHISVDLALKRFAHQVRVFGDDIIVPSNAVPNVVRLLEAYGFLLNTDKSFWTGKFRESCGGDYYAGEDVSYVKVRRRFPSDKSEITRIESAVALRNRFYSYGYWRTVAWMDEWLVELLRVYPSVSPSSSLLGRVTYLSPEDLRMHPQLQIPVTTGFEVSRRIPVNQIEGVDALTRYFFEKDEGDSEDALSYITDEQSEVERFHRSGRPTHETLKRRTRPF